MEKQIVYEFIKSINEHNVNKIYELMDNDNIYTENYIIPKGMEKEDLKAREKIINEIYRKWSDNNPDKCAYNFNLNDCRSAERQKENTILHYGNHIKKQVLFRETPVKPAFF